MLFVPDVTIAEKIFRSVIIYGFLLVAFRLTGKRQMGQFTPSDLVLFLVIAREDIRELANAKSFWRGTIWLTKETLWPRITKIQ
jgi:uncharacterized membrane protein YcaP (DUF421 family)